ncbi:MAG TPA: hypothetical protein VMA72_11015 [Streptosporangiaceae bacterium]|nr:hypothetical protein [Streptosporangiaceae bacterium]
MTRSALSRGVLSQSPITGVRRAMATAASVGAGMAAAWLAAGSTGVLAGMAVLLAAGNGYAKAYSP